VVPAHITLVFPFESPLGTDELRAHIERMVQGIGPFPLCLAGVTGMNAEYLFLNVKRANDALIELHDFILARCESTFRSHLPLRRT
jgi:hypothetical protein